MLAALGALMAAVVTTLLYLVLTEEMDYASVQRRQLDAWAAFVAVLCMGLILYGNASVSRSVEQSPNLPVVPDEPAPPVWDAPLEGPRQAATEEPAAETEESPLVIAEAQPAGAEEAPRVEAPPEPASVDEPLPAEGPSEDDAPESVFPKPGFSDDPTQVPPTRTPSATPTTAPSPSPTLLARATFKTATPPPRPTEPTAEPTAVAVLPTPHCGDPAEIAVKVGELKTEVERAGSDVLVHFSFDVRNDSPFPVTLVDFTVAARAQNPWRERFGHVSLSDVRVEPGAVFPVRESLVIERFPAPNERVQMCANFVPKSCGASRPENGVDGRCWNEMPSLFFETEFTSP